MLVFTMLLQLWYPTRAATLHRGRAAHKARLPGFNAWLPPLHNLHTFGQKSLLWLNMQTVQQLLSFRDQENYFAYSKFFYDRLRGVYLEVGAHDGVRPSNS